MHSLLDQKQIGHFPCRSLCVALSSHLSYKLVHPIQPALNYDSSKIVVLMLANTQLSNLP
ncbi:hypothetical protein ERO13_D08G269950v2 [Gossypium hirsutum]|nr:hypothetical protein ERO13_D08G269950v2 [Gossypium hirsutum]